MSIGIVDDNDDAKTTMVMTRLKIEEIATAATTLT